MRLVVVTAAAAFVCLACDPAFSIEGRVTACDTQDELVGVRVELYYGERVRAGEVVSDGQSAPDGSFRVGSMGFGDGEMTLLFTKPGYEHAVRHLRDASESPIEQCLEPFSRARHRSDAGVSADEDAGE